MKLPLKVVVDLVERVDDRWFYELVIEVPESEDSVTIALIESDLDGEANVTHLKKDGLVDLDEDVRDRLLVALFRLAYREMRANDGSAIEWHISDISRFLVS